MSFDVVIEPRFKGVNTSDITSSVEIELHISIKTINTESLLGSKRESKFSENVIMGFVM